LEQNMSNLDHLNIPALNGVTRSEPGIGPSDTSDSVNDLPEEMQDTDSDRHATGERPSVEERPDISSGEDVDVDRTVFEDEAGLSTTPPDPVRNGGRPEDAPEE
jgi:hypothetical protein